MLVALAGSLNQCGDLVEQANNPAIVALEALKLFQKRHGRLAIKPAGLLGS